MLGMLAFWVTLLWSVQRRWARKITSISHITYVERLKVLKLFSIFGRLLRAWSCLVVIHVHTFFFNRPLSFRLVVLGRKNSPFIGCALAGLSPGDTACWKIFHSEDYIKANCSRRWFTVAVDRRTRVCSFKIVVPRCELEIRRRFFHEFII